MHVSHQSDLNAPSPVSEGSLVELPLAMLGTSSACSCTDTTPVGVLSQMGVLLLLGTRLLGGVNLLQALPAANCHGAAGPLRHRSEI